MREDLKEGRFPNMTTYELLLLLAVLIVAPIQLYLWLNAAWERRKLRLRLSRSTAVELMCRGDYFHLNDMLKVCRLSTRTCNVWYDSIHYVATIGGRKRIRLTLIRTKDCYVLERVESYSDRNWQFTGWYDHYLREDDKMPPCYTAFGEVNLDEANRKKRLPWFMLSRNAIEALCEECTS